MNFNNNSGTAFLFKVNCYQRRYQLQYNMLYKIQRKYALLSC